MKNLASILKYCPEGTKLYSPIYGEVTFKGISSINNILCKATRRNGDTICSHGTYIKTTYKNGKEARKQFRKYKNKY